jgi:hypothetical protein
MASASVPSIDGLMKDELLALSATIQKQLKADIQPIVLKHGEWITGKDIPEGTYTVSSLSDTAGISLYIDGGLNDGFMYIVGAPEKRPTVLVTLVSGTVFRIAVDDLQFTLVTVVE